MDGWALAVDVGDTSVIAAVSQGDRTELVEFAGGQAISPAVFLAAGQPTLAGAAGLAKDASPPRNAISPKRALAAGDAAAIAGSDIPLAKAYAAIMTNVAREAARGRPSATPDRLALTHPAAWGERELGVLREAASAADLPDPLLIAEPVAAACYLATDARPGQARSWPSSTWAATASTLRCSDGLGTDSNLLALPVA
jgi:molecular chaperone DnaK (HSP70)